MTYPHGTLTQKQIRTTCFEVPSLAIEFIYGPGAFAAFAVRRKLIRDTGGDLLLIGWTDGTTVEYSRPIAKQELEVADLAKFYPLFHAKRAEFDAQGEKS